jgi:hypothetical protein
VVNRLRGMTIGLTEDEAAQLLRELDAIIASDRYFLSPRITRLKAIRSKLGNARRLGNIRR